MDSICNVNCRSYRNGWAVKLHQFCGNIDLTTEVELLDAFQQICEEEAIQAIVHFAAESHVDRSIDSSRPFLETNILGTAVLLEVVRRHPSIHFHHVSTDEVYGTLGETGLFTETTAYDPHSPYSAS